jgi:hypothetical protein
MMDQKHRATTGRLSSVSFLVAIALAVSPEGATQEVVANDLAPLQDLGATVFGVSAGAFGGVIAGTLTCPLLNAGNDSGLWACVSLSSPVIFLAGGIGGIFGGMHGYQNSQLFVMAGGVVAGGLVGAPFGPAMTLTAMGGGVLGYMLWDARDVREAQYSLLPYWDKDRSGVLVSGRF